MHIEWVWDTDRAPDPMHIADFFITALVVLAVLFFLASQVLVVLRRNTVSVRARRWWSLELMILGSITHIVAEFVSNSHMGQMPWFDYVRTFHCTFWDYWFKYGLGFNLWQVGQAGRMFAWWVTLEMKSVAVPALVQDMLHVVGPNGESDLTLGQSAANDGETTQIVSTKESSTAQSDAIHSFSFNSGAIDDNASVRSTPYVPRSCECTTIRRVVGAVYGALYKRRYGILVFVACTMFGLPGLLLCLGVELTHSIEYSEVYRWCVTHSGFVYITVGWLLACVLVLALLLLRMRKYDSRESTSYRATRDSTYIGVGFLIVLVIANRFEVSVTWWGRSLQTFMVIALYVFSYMRLNWGMYRDAFLYGFGKENPIAHESTLSDIECVLSGEDKEPTLASIMRTIKSRTQFIRLLYQLPLWELPSTFSSAMDPDQLSVHFAARCRAKFRSDGTMYVEKPGVRRLRLKDISNVSSDQFLIEDEGDELVAGNTHNYHFPASGQQQQNGFGLMVEIPEEFKQVSLHESTLSSHARMPNIVRDAQTHAVEVCPSDVWLLYVAYTNYRRLVDEQRTIEAVAALREILTTHFRLADPPAERILVNDPASVQNGSTSSINSVARNEPTTVTTTPPSQATQLSTARVGSVSFATAAASGVVYFPPSATSDSNTNTTLTPVPLAVIASRSIDLDSDSAYSQSSSSANSGTSILLLDCKCQSTTRTFAQFFKINLPNQTQNGNEVVEALQHGGIHTLPLSNTHLRDAYIAAAQCREDMDMCDPLDSVGWMCEFLLGEVWLAWCIHHVPNFYRMYKAERRTMATLVAMDDGIASRPQRVAVTVV